jgi:hypothetical protein
MSILAVMLLAVAHGRDSRQGLHVKQLWAILRGCGKLRIAGAVGMAEERRNGNFPGFSSEIIRPGPIPWLALGSDSD